MSHAATDRKTRSSPPPTSTKLWSADGVPGVMLLRGHFVDTHFPPHFHEHFVIGVTESGLHNALCAGERLDHRGPGEVVVIPPGEVHTGETVNGVPWLWRAFYPTAATMMALSRELGLTTTELPLRAGCHPDGTLAAKLLAAHVAFEHGELLRGSELLLDCLSTLLVRSGRMAARTPEKHEPTAVRRAREFLFFNLAENVRLSDLNDVAGLDTFRLLRAFSKTHGVTPHRYLLGLRIERAKQLIQAGQSLATVAGESGFCDQSHLTRYFKRCVGVTPQAFARAVGAATAV